MKKTFWYLSLLLLPIVGLTACSDDDDEENLYATWDALNTAWFYAVADSARTAIAAARAQYGDDWEAHCEWRMYKSLRKSADYRGPVTDSVCIHFRHFGEGTTSPRYTDSVRVSFRGYIKPTHTLTKDGRDSLAMTVFTQTYYGTYDPEKAAPQLMAVSSTIAGFSTALQYMHVGDDAWVYMPQQLAYGTTANGSIPPYSSLVFRIHLVGIYPPGEVVPPWK